MLWTQLLKNIYYVYLLCAILLVLKFHYVINKLPLNVIKLMLDLLCVLCIMKYDFRLSSHK
jgi:hypothetical protein